MAFYKIFIRKVLSLLFILSFGVSGFSLALPTVLAASTANPTLSDACGLNLVLVLDSSSSMAVSDIATAKAAATTLVNGLMPSTPTKIGVIDFNTGIQGTSLSPTSDKTAVLNKISTYVNHPNGASTNWQAALNAADGMVGAGDLVVIITDGDPNTPTNATVALADAVTSANSIKAKGARMLAIGINSSGTQGGLNEANLEAISGPQVKNFPAQSITNVNQVDVAVGDISGESQVLASLANALCGGTLSVTAQTPYNVTSGATVPFQYTVTVTQATAQCRLLDNTETPVNGGAGAGAYGTANPINWVVPDPPGPYAYYVQCQNASFTNIVAISNQITVNVTLPPAPDLTAAAPVQTNVIRGIASSFTSVISNIGNATTSAAFPNFFQVATGSQGSGTLTDLPSATMATLAASDVDTANVTYTFGALGTSSVRACANKFNRNTFGPIVESNTDNNCSPWTDVTVSNAPLPVVTISATPISGLVGSIRPTITWSATNNPTSCTASGDWSGAKNPTGGTQQQGALTSVKTYVYTITCTNVGGESAPASATVIANPLPPPAAATLIANPTPSVIVLGQTVLLTWTSSGASSCQGTNFDTGGATQNLVGVPVVPPTLPMTYTLICTNSQGIPSAPSSVTITAAKKRPIYSEP